LFVLYSAFTDFGMKPQPMNESLSSPVHTGRDAQVAQVKR
jgi:hypothetical protein